MGNTHGTPGPTDANEVKSEGTGTNPQQKTPDDKIENLTKRLKDTQTAFHERSVKVSSLEAENEELKAQLRSALVRQFELSQVQQDELEVLKITDPDQWRVKANKYEEAAKTAVEEKFNQTIKAISESAQTKASQKPESSTKDFRDTLLKLSAKYSDIEQVVTDQAVSYELSKKELKVLQEKQLIGEMTSEDVAEYLYKRIKGGAAAVGPNVEGLDNKLGNMSGSANPKGNPEPTKTWETQVF